MSRSFSIHRINAARLNSIATFQPITGSLTTINKPQLVLFVADASVAATQPYSDWTMFGINGIQIMVVSRVPRRVHSAKLTSITRVN